MVDLLISGGTVVHRDGTEIASVAVQDGRIVGIGAEESFSPPARRIDASGHYVLPGRVDAHVHLDMSCGGRAPVEDVTDGTIAAALGGVTTVIDFATQRRGESALRAVDDKLRKAEGKAVVDFGLHAILVDASGPLIGDMRRLIERGVASFKLYLVYREQDKMATDDVLFKVLREAAEHGGLACVHAENEDIAEANTAAYLAAGHSAPIYHALSKPNVVEAEAINRALYLARYVGAALYIVHMSTAEGVDLIRDARQRGQAAYAETCTHYLALTDEVYRRPDGYKWIISPPLRTVVDQERLWGGLRDGWVHTVASDDCGWDTAVKQYGQAPFNLIANGAPGIDARLPFVFSEGVNGGRLSIEQFVQVTATNPARIFGLYPRKGVLAVGSDADVAIVDPNARHTLTVNRRYRRVDWSPLEGIQVQGALVMTIANGQIVVDRGEFIGRPGAGRFLERRIDPEMLARPR